MKKEIKFLDIKNQVNTKGLSSITRSNKKNLLKKLKKIEPIPIFVYRILFLILISAITGIITGIYKNSSFFEYFFKENKAFTIIVSLFFLFFIIFVFIYYLIDKKFNKKYNIEFKTLENSLLNSIKKEDEQFYEKFRKSKEDLINLVYHNMVHKHNLNENYFEIFKKEFLKFIDYFDLDLIDDAGSFEDESHAATRYSGSKKEE